MALLEQRRARNARNAERFVRWRVRLAGSGCRLRRGSCAIAAYARTTRCRNCPARLHSGPASRRPKATTLAPAKTRSFKKWRREMRLEARDDRRQRPQLQRRCPTAIARSRRTSICWCSRRAKKTGCSRRASGEKGRHPGDSGGPQRRSASGRPRAATTSLLTGSDFIDQGHRAADWPAGASSAALRRSSNSKAGLTGVRCE